MLLMNTPPASKRLFAVRIVQWGVMGLALWNLGRAVALGREIGRLADLGLHLIPDPRLRLAFSAGWVILFMAAFVVLRRRKPWSPLFIPFLLVLYGVYEIGMIMIYTPEPPAFLPVSIYIVFVGFVSWVMWRSSRLSATSSQGDY